MQHSSAPGPFPHRRVPLIRASFPLSLTLLLTIPSTLNSAVLNQPAFTLSFAAVFSLRISAHNALITLLIPFPFLPLGLRQIKQIPFFLAAINLLSKQVTRVSFNFKAVA